MKYLLIALFVLSTGCTTIQPSPVTNYINANKELANTGSMKWSDYYKGLYDAMSKQNLIGTGAQLEQINNMIDLSLSYEAGTINTEQYDSATRAIKAKAAQADESARSQSIRDYQAQHANDKPPPVYQYKPPVRTQCTSYGNTVNCSTQ